jgi:hypothetical protein
MVEVMQGVEIGIILIFFMVLVLYFISRIDHKLKRRLENDERIMNRLDLIYAEQRKQLKEQPSLFIDKRL